jgi:pSer/pThr/pTyr-binding forkhead associated (FHA) protein
MFILKDLGSTNGTYVKSTPVEKVRIRHRDKFRIGDTLIQFILEETSGVQVYEVQDEDD